MRRLAWLIPLLVLASACDDEDDDELASVMRGRYLVENVAACGDCHTPRLAGGAPDTTRLLAGNDCLLDLTPDDSTTGCLATPNLTSDPDALGGLSDREIRNMFQNGIDDEGHGLIPVMPYQVFHHLTDADAESIVRYLRTVPAVARTTTSQAPWMEPAEPAAPIPDGSIPRPTTVTQAAQRGRYLATIACVDCHTRRTDPQDFGAYDLTALFAGGQVFPARALGLTTPPFPQNIYTWNLTPDDTGIGQFTEQQIVDVLELGHDPEGHGICPPMPAGPMGAFGGLADEDAAAIAAYLKAIPPVNNAIPADCTPPE